MGFFNSSRLKPPNFTFLYPGTVLGIKNRLIYLIYPPFCVPILLHLALQKI